MKPVTAIIPSIAPARLGKGFRPPSRRRQILHQPTYSFAGTYDMPLDHYVSQVHLRNFYSPVSERLYAIRKSNLKRFEPRSKDVCRIVDGSTNAYLTHDRAIEEFLKGVESKYNASLATLREGGIDEESIYAFAGFASYVAGCAPTAMRTLTGPLKANLEATVTILDSRGLFRKAPASLGGKSPTERLSDGTVHIKVDGKYPQAIGIRSIIRRVSIFGNSPWEILRNGEPDTPFFTSDFPVAIEQRPDGNVNRIVPLAPDLAVRIIPDVRLSRAKPDLSFANFRCRHRTLSRAEILKVNRLIVQCAEDLIFYRDDQDWIERFVAKHRHYRIESVTERIPHGNGFLTVVRLRVADRRAT